MTLLIAFGFILNGHQIVHNCYIGMTRVMVAHVVRPAAARVGQPRQRPAPTPVNAHVIYFLASIPVIVLYNNFTYGDG